VYVIYARLLLAASVWGMAIFGLLRRLRAGRVDLAPLVGFVVPFFVLGGQSYGGEAILRVFLFSLPFAAIFATFALLPTEKVKLNLTRSVLLMLVSALLVPTFWLTRYGNEQFEYISKDDYRGALKLAQIAPEGSNILALDGNVGNQVLRMEQFAFITVPVPIGKAPDYDPQFVVNTAEKAPGSPSFLFLNHSQVANIALTYGKPKTFYNDVTQQLVASGKFHIIYENPDARIFSIDTADTIAKATP
jgi:hypothetical protein